MGTESLPVQFIVTNEGQMMSGAISVSVTGANPTAFIIVPTGDSTDCAAQMLAPTSTCVVQVKYRPDTSGAETASLHIDASPGGMKIVGLSGDGLVPGGLEVTTPASGIVTFASTAIQSMTASQTITIHNKGGVPCTSLVITLNDTTNYTKTSTTCGASLAANATCDIDVRFNPAAVGMHVSSVTVTSDQGAVAPQLTGTGTSSVTVTKAGTGGSVADTLSTPIISCGSTCTGTYSQTPITFHATTSGGIPFDSWGDDCASAGSSPDCTLALTKPMSKVSANFGVCVPGTGMCASGMLQTCNSAGQWSAPSMCTLGCFTDGTRCYDVNPSNGLAAALDDARTQPSYTLMDGAQFNTTTQKVIDGDGSPVPIKSVLVHQSGAPDIVVFEVGSLTASAFTVTGEGAFAIVSNGDVSITGVVSVVFQSFYLSPGSVQAGDPCGGVLIATGNKTRMAGTGGGSFSTTGARGGNDSPSTGSAPGTPPAWGLTPLRGGCPGGFQFDNAGQYGAGGGATQIVSRTTIKITGSGVINMGGGGASGLAGGNGGGAGGGSGGGILLEAPSVVLSGAAAGLAVNGGGGGSNCATGQGEDGKPSVAVAHGGTCTGTKVTNGGNGASGTTLPTQGVDFATGIDGGVAGGGGGGQGLIHINTFSGFSKLNGAFISGYETEGSLGLR
jgi:hypothetical protein